MSVVVKFVFEMDRPNRSPGTIEVKLDNEKVNDLERIAKELLLMNNGTEAASHYTYMRSTKCAAMS
jgi:hypothetical protein